MGPTGYRVAKRRLPFPAGMLSGERFAGPPLIIHDSGRNAMKQDALQRVSRKRSADRRDWPRFIGIRS